MTARFPPPAAGPQGTVRAFATPRHRGPGSPFPCGLDHLGVAPSTGQAHAGKSPDVGTPSGLLVERVDPLHQPGRVHVAAELVEAGEQRPPVGEPLDGDAIERHVAVALRPEGAVGDAEEAGAGGVVRLVLHLRLQAHVAGNRRRRRALRLRDHRTERRPPAGRLRALSRPVMHMKSEWSSTASAMERTMAYLSAMRARRWRCSQISMPKRSSGSA